MPEASFYLLETSSARDKHLFACKLIEKAYRNGHYCYVLTDSDEQSQAMDDLLWAFRAGSFVPHQQYTGELPELEQVVLIGSLNPPESRKKNLVNLSSHLPQAFEQAERIFEILDSSEASKEAGRTRYRQYRQSGFETVKYKIEN